jgi:hypothetical protein
MTNGVPGDPMAGAKPVIVGTGVCERTLNGTPLVAVPAGEDTAIDPLVASGGTVTTSSVDDAVSTVAATPLNKTMLAVVVRLNPVPEMLTVVPTAPLGGEKPRIESRPAACRAIDRRLPTASY